MDRDLALHQRYIEARDAECFAELVRRHAGEVLVTILVVMAALIGGLVYLAARPPEPPAREPSAPATKPKEVAVNGKREGKRVQIEDFREFDNSDEALSHLAAIACVLRGHGERVDWNWLMGVSGEAFCYYYHPDGTFLSGMVHSWNVAEAALRACGYRGTWHSAAAAPASLAVIRSELERGRPVIAPGIMPAPDGIHSRCHYWFVVTGLDAAAQKVTLLGVDARPVQTTLPIGDSKVHPCWYGILRTFAGIEGHYGPPRKDNPVLTVIREAERPDRRTLVLEGLRRAVALAREESATATFGYGRGTYLAGHTALQRLHDDLLAAPGDGVEAFRKLNPGLGDPFGGLGDELVFLQLLATRRRAAAAFLEEAAGVLPEPTRPHMASAAKHFRAAGAAAIEAFTLRYGAEAEFRRIAEIIRQGTYGDDNPDWTAYWQRADEALADPEKRRQMAARVAHVLEAEVAAIGEIEKVLAATDMGEPAAQYLFSPEELPRWHVTPGYENQKPWRFKGGAYEGFDSWAAHPGVFGDFVLEVEILFSGKEGGVVIRGDKDSREPWTSGYELDIDWAADRQHGHIHFPVKPKPYCGDALIDVGKWHAVKVRAAGERVTVFLDGEQALQFTDAEFSKGQICLEGHAGGVKYRNLRVMPMNINVERKGGRVWIKAVPLPEGKNSVLASLTSVLQGAGEDVSYDYLMGVSSRAFRLQFSWCPSAPHSFCGFNTFEPALRAVGYEVQDYPLAAWEAETRKQRSAAEAERAAAMETVRKFIDAGVPVLFGSEEEGVLVGYEPVGDDNPTGWLRRPGPLGPPPKGDAAYAAPIKKLPWGVTVVRKAAAGPADRRQSILWSLRTAVRNARTAECGGYAMGFAAWERWIRELQHLLPVIARTQEHFDKFDTNEQAPFEIQLGNAWCYDSLIDARRCAAQYLRSIAGELGQDAAAHLLAAADAYEQVVKTLTEGVACPTMVAPYPWMKKEAWTQQKRTEQAERLRRALAHERNAIAAIEKALAALPAEDAAPEEADAAVVLDNIERIFKGLFEESERGKGTPWCERSDAYMYLTCMRAAGWGADYAEVITLSGYGLSFGYSQEKWWAHYFPPPGRDGRIGRATGFGFRWQQYKTPEEYWQALRQTLDRGTPVYGPYMEGVLFIGYRDAAKPEDRQVRPLALVFVEPGEWWTWEKFTDWHRKHSDGGWFGCYGGSAEMAPPRDSAVEVLRLIVQMATDDPRSHQDRFKGVTWGLAGILAYAADVADMSKSGEDREKGGYFQGGWRGCHNVYPQMSGRPAAAVCLRRIAPLFEGDVRQHVLAAAGHYDRATDAWREFEKQLGRPLGDKHGAAWQDPEHRRAGAAAVRLAHDHEKNAIAEIEKALAALDVKD